MSEYFPARTWDVTVAIPAFVSDAPDGWTEFDTVVNGAPMMEDIFPSPAPDGSSGPRAITDAWAGGALDYQRNYGYNTGGGHGDYAGNEVMRYNLNGTTMPIGFERPYGPTHLNPPQDGSEEYATDTPSSVHTWDAVCFVPTTAGIANSGHIYRGPGAPWGPGSQGSSMWRYNMATNLYTRLDNAGAYGSWAGLDWDPTSQRIIHKGRDNSGFHYFQEYDINGNSFTTPVADPTAASDEDSSARVHNGLRLLVEVGDAAGSGPGAGLVTWDLDANGVASNQSVPAFTDTGGVIASVASYGYGPGIDLDTERNMFTIFWGGNLATIDVTPGTWVVTMQQADGAGTPPDDAGPTTRGVLGAFRYHPGWRVFFLFHQTNANVWMWKPGALY